MLLGRFADRDVAEMPRPKFSLTQHVSHTVPFNGQPQDPQKHGNLTAASVPTPEKYGHCHGPSCQPAAYEGPSRPLCSITTNLRCTGGKARGVIHDPPAASRNTYARRI